MVVPSASSYIPRSRRRLASALYARGGGFPAGFLGVGPERLFLQRLHSCRESSPTACRRIDAACSCDWGSRRVSFATRRLTWSFALSSAALKLLPSSMRDGFLSVNWAHPQG